MCKIKEVIPRKSKYAPGDTASDTESILNILTCI